MYLCDQTFLITQVSHLYLGIQINDTLDLIVRYRIDDTRLVSNRDDGAFCIFTEAVASDSYSGTTCQMRKKY